LTAIRAFVAVSRHGSFSRAAQALGVTQSALSRHVATLEKLSGTRLFDRRGSGIELTPSGSQYFDAIKDALATIELATQQICQAGQTHNRLRVRTSMPSFAMTVVVPALALFTAKTQIEIDLITSLAAPQPRDEFDVLITRDLHVPNTESWELLQEELVCVGAPAVVAKHLAGSVDRWPMIGAKSRPDALALWATALDIAPQRLHVSAMYDHLFLAVSAAIGGTGLLVAPKLVVLDHLNSGTLVPADAKPVSSGATYTAFINPGSHHLQSSREFCRWLKGMLRARNNTDSSSRPGAGLGLARAS
jgi:DNA-binding transcriptional LysR family regulator